MNAEQKALFDRLTQLQQRVATNVLAGMSQRQAYYAAGGSAKTDLSADATSSELLSNPNVVAFMDSMKVQAVSEAIMSREEAMKKLSLLARTDLKDIVEFQTREVGRDLDTGEPVMQTGWFIPDSVLQSRDKLSIISELTAGKDGIKIKAHSQLSAIKQLAEMQGWNSAQKVQMNITRSAEELTDDELAALAAEADAQADHEG